LLLKPNFIYIDDRLASERVTLTKTNHSSFVSVNGNVVYYMHTAANLYAVLGFKVVSVSEESEVYVYSYISL